MTRLRLWIIITVTTIALVSCAMTLKQKGEIGKPAQAAGENNCRPPATGDGILFMLPSDARLQRHPDTQTVVSMKGRDLSRALDGVGRYRNLLAQKRFYDAAVCFLDFYNQVFRLDHPARELSPASVRTDDLGMTHVRLVQGYEGIPVWPGEITVHFSAQGAIYWVQGHYIPTPRKMDPTAGIQKADALKIVAGELVRYGPDSAPGSAELVIWAGCPEKPALAYRVSSRAGLTKGWDFFIDAATGAVLGKISTVNTEPVPVLGK